MNAECLTMLSEDVKQACATVSTVLAYITSHDLTCDEATLCQLHEAHAALVIVHHALANLRQYNVHISARK